MKYLVIKAKRNAYSARQCRNTITIGELIEELRQHDKNLPVFTISDNGYTFGNITEYDILERFESDEDEDDEEDEDE